MNKLTIISAVTAVFMLLFIQPSFCATYSSRSLGVAPDYDGSWATAIDDGGVIICASVNASDDSGVFAWNRSTGMTNLSSLGIMAGSGINSQGQTVGMYKDETAAWYRPYIHNEDGTTRNLMIPADAADVWPVSIINGSRVVADINYRDSDGTIIETKTAVIGEDGSTAFVEYLHGYTSAKAISNSGTIITRGYMWTASEGISILPWLAGDVDIRAVNDLGWIVGISNGHVLRRSSGWRRADSEWRESSAALDSSPPNHPPSLH